MVEGYKKAAMITKEIGEEQVNKHSIYIHFKCKKEPTV